ncbi:MAG: Hsp20/alpha crystallin family protein [Rhodospirillales bacterium]|nr:Hsp20/alpha crystallin family protein [Rhodospirillales bacterium]
MPWRWPPRETPAGGQGTAEPLRALQADINNAFDSFWRSFPAPAFHANWGMSVQASEPRVDLIETASGIEISAEMPGFNEQDIEVALSDECLTITAEKFAQRDQSTSRYRINERIYGRISRTIPFPVGVDSDNVKASYANGVLTIVVQKREADIQDIKHIPIEKS